MFGWLQSRRCTVHTRVTQESPQTVASHAKPTKYRKNVREAGHVGLLWVDPRRTVVLCSTRRTIGVVWHWTYGTCSTSRWPPMASINVTIHRIRCARLSTGSWHSCASFQRLGVCQAWTQQGDFPGVASHLRGASTLCVLSAWQTQLQIRCARPLTVSCHRIPVRLAQAVDRS